MSGPIAMSFTLTPGDVNEHNRRFFTVNGSTSCPQSGYRVWIQPGNEGIWDNPKLEVLELRAEAPELGSDVMTDVPVLYSWRDHPELEEVTLRLRDGIATDSGEDVIVLWVHPSTG